MPESTPPGSESSAVPLDEVTGALENLGELLREVDDFRVLLLRVCELVTTAVPGVDEASVTLLRDGEPYTAAATSGLVFRLDQAQYRAGTGPCLQAAATGMVVRAAIDEARTRWPEFAECACDAGMGGFLCVPLAVDEQHAGAINCYSVVGHSFVAVEGQLLELYTTAVEASLRAHRRYSEARAVAEQLRKALDSRGVIEQAKGIIMAARRISADEAFTALVEQSQRENVKLRDLARRLVMNILTGA